MVNTVLTEDNTRLLSKFMDVRRFTEKIIQPLQTEDFMIQANEDVSPAKWHLGHTTWFFEAFLLLRHNHSYRAFDPKYDHLFNSYYITHGTPFDRPSRGVLSRPTIQEIMEYRLYVEKHLLEFLTHVDKSKEKELLSILEVGINHEQQHQELLFTDIKYNFSVNPIQPTYRDYTPTRGSKAPKLEWKTFNEGLSTIGTNGESFSFDNEFPNHKVWLDEFSIASRPVTNGEYMEFIKDEGYETAEYWLSDGWNVVNEKKWDRPLYWQEIDGVWHHFTLHGLQEVNLDEPVSHVSYYEADAYARWAGKRLPTEMEWEHAFSEVQLTGNFSETQQYHPNTDYQETNGLMKGFGDVWEWTRSPYTPYPGNKPYEGVLGEYNAKFMSNQMVLRGGSCVTPVTHIRHTYRNFFNPEKRWQFSGIRLAGDCS